VGETPPADIQSWVARLPFSILERIDVGETYDAVWCGCFHPRAFSILERIDVGETRWVEGMNGWTDLLSVSSNGSTWVKLAIEAGGSTTHWDLSVSSNGSTWVKRACW